MYGVMQIIVRLFLSANVLSVRRRCTTSVSANVLSVHRRCIVCPSSMYCLSVVDIRLLNIPLSSLVICKQTIVKNTKSQFFKLDLLVQYSETAMLQKKESLNTNCKRKSNVKFIRGNDYYYQGVKFILTKLKSSLFSQSLVEN